MEYFHNATACEIANLDAVILRPSTLSVIMNSYSIFFPIYDEVTGNTIPAKDLSDLDLSLPPDVDIEFQAQDIGRHGTLLGHLLSDAGVLTRAHTAFIIEHMFQGIALKMGVHDIEVALRILTYFSTDLENEFFFKRNAEYSLYEGCLELEHGIDICNNISAANDMCKVYCQELAYAAKYSADIVAEIFNLALKRSSTTWDTSSRNILPDCSWKKSFGQPCWDKIMTQKGVCFSNYHYTGSGTLCTLARSSMRCCASSCRRMWAKAPGCPKALLTWPMPTAIT